MAEPIAGMTYSATGVSSSKQPRLELIPYEALIRMAARFELGVAKRPDGSAWNALAKTQACLTDMPFILERIGHLLHHAAKLEAKLLGAVPDDGDDDAGAILWSGAFLACATRALADQRRRRCHGCGGTGRFTSQINHTFEEKDCPACHGTGYLR